MQEKRIFEGKKVYYSGSIRGTPERDPEFAWKLVRFMIDNGADVLSEHVAGRNSQEMAEIRFRRMGARSSLVDGHPEPWWEVRRQDVAWVDEASHMVALVNGPSHGVGMEIERALLKPERNLNVTPILALARVDMMDKITWMIKGIADPNFKLAYYEDLETACKEISQLLVGFKFVN